MPEQLKRLNQLQLEYDALLHKLNEPRGQTVAEVVKICERLEAISVEIRQAINGLGNNEVPDQAFT